MNKIEQFNNFLEHNNCKDKFYNNLEEPSRIETEEFPHYYILGAFAWLTSPEGVDYWSKLSGEWCDYLDETSEE